MCHRRQCIFYKTLYVVNDGCLCPLTRDPNHQCRLNAHREHAPARGAGRVVRGPHRQRRRGYRVGLAGHAHVHGRKLEIASGHLAHCACRAGPCQVCRRVRLVPERVVGIVRRHRACRRQGAASACSVGSCGRACACPGGCRACACPGGCRACPCPGGCGACTGPGVCRACACPAGCRAFACPGGCRAFACPGGCQACTGPGGCRACACPGGCRACTGPASQASLSAFLQRAVPSVETPHQRSAERTRRAGQTCGARSGQARQARQTCGACGGQACQARQARQTGGACGGQARQTVRHRCQIRSCWNATSAVLGPSKIN